MTATLSHEANNVIYVQPIFRQSVSEKKRAIYYPIAIDKYLRHWEGVDLVLF